VWLGDLDFETVTYHTKLAIEEGSLRFDRLALLPYRVGLLKNFYKAALQGADIVVASKSSEVSLAKMGLVAKYLPYPWPSPVVSPNRSYTPGAVPRLLFSGTLQALGSRSAFHMLLNELYPLMRVKFGADGFELLLTGAGELPVWVRESVAAKPEIQFLGFVPDLIEVMDSCSAFLAPINVPVGNRSRILTAMAARIPVVAHASTAMGNPLLVDGVTCLLADSAPKFVHQLEKLLADATLAENIAGSARHAYLKNHQPSHATGMLIAHLSAAAAGR
jgi:glycosyltransferase involved in cell wall biosynthesis